MILSISNLAQRLQSLTSINLLFLTPQLPYPPRQGTAIRNWGLIQHLALRGHSITLLTFVTPGPTANAPELLAACERVISIPMPQRSRADRLRTLFSSHADLARRLWSDEFASALTRLLHESEFDFVHIEGLEMAAYLTILKREASHLQFLYDAHNAEYLLQQRALRTDSRQPARWPAALYSALQVPRLRQFEKEICQSVNAVMCVSSEDANALQKLFPALTPIVIPNGIDVEAYATFHASRPPSTFHLPPSTCRLVFTGKMDYRPNLDAALWFAREIFPQIRAAQPQAEFVVVGQQPPESLRKLSGHGQRGMVVTGAVDDVRPYIAEAAVYVAPLRMGGGTRFKLLEAMALARPIVSTHLGAEGFTIEAGREMALADSPVEFAEAVLALLNNPARAQALGVAGQAFVRASYDWEAIVPRLEAVYASAR